MPRHVRRSRIGGMSGFAVVSTDGLGDIVGAFVGINDRRVGHFSCFPEFVGGWLGHSSRTARIGVIQKTFTPSMRSPSKIQRWATTASIGSRPLEKFYSAGVVCGVGCPVIVLTSSRRWASRSTLWCWTCHW